MKAALASAELVMMRSVFRRHPQVQEVRLFGSRAKGSQTARSDIDLALFGDVSLLEGQAIESELDDLPLPYKYDVQVFHLIKSQDLRDHIQRVGISLYPDLSSQLQSIPEQDSVVDIEACYRGLIAGQKDLWMTLRSVSPEETRALISLGLSETNGSYREVAARFHVDAEDYRKFMEFLRRHDCAIDFRPYRKVISRSG
jgi:uncharacterized protein